MPSLSKKTSRLARFWCWLWNGHDNSNPSFESGRLKNPYHPDFEPNKYEDVRCSICGEIIGRKLIK